MKKLSLLLSLTFCLCAFVAKAQNVGINNTNPQAALDVQGDLRFRSAILTLPANVNNNVDLSAVKSSVYMFAGGALTGCQITGFTGGVDGRIVTIFNNSSSATIQLYDESNVISPSNLSNKILTGTGNTAVVNQNGSISLRYDGTKQRWTVINSNYTNGLSDEFWKRSGLAGNEIKATNSGGIWSSNGTSLDDATTTDITNPPTAPESGAGTRLMWIPSRSAFRIGTVQNTPSLPIGSSYWDSYNIGLFSFASGYSSLASGKHSIAMGNTAWASAISGVAIGNAARATGLNSTAFGNNTLASGDYSLAMGKNTTASGESSTAIGLSSIASGNFSTALGRFTTASGTYSTTLGSGTTASGNYSIATGFNSTASGFASASFGAATYATGLYSTSMGNNTQAVGDYSTAMGYGSYAPGLLSTAMGNTTQAIGDYSTTMGYETYANGLCATAIGIFNQVNANALFMVGNGVNNANRYNTFTIRKDNNCVGINNDNPLAALHVSGNQNVSGGQGSFFYPYNQTYVNSSVGYLNLLTNLSSFGATLGILSDYGIVSKTYVGSGVNIVASDNRIKNIIGISNNAEDLERLKKIQITNYSMKDVNTWGNQVFKKVIAQQVEEVYPEVIKKQKSTIPDIYTLAESVAYNEKNKELTITLNKSYDIKIGDKIELVHPTHGKQLAEVTVVEGNVFTVNNWQYATDKIFVFGKEVNDFRNVDYEALSMLGISAIQQLAKEVEDLKAENKKLATDFESRLKALELKLHPTIATSK